MNHKTVTPTTKLEEAVRQGLWNYLEGRTPGKICRNEYEGIVEAILDTAQIPFNGAVGLLRRWYDPERKDDCDLIPDTDTFLADKKETI